MRACKECECIRLGFEIPDQSWIGSAIGGELKIKGIVMGCFMIIHALKWHFFTSFTRSWYAEQDTFPISHSGAAAVRENIEIRFQYISPPNKSWCTSGKQIFGENNMCDKTRESVDHLSEINCSVRNYLLLGMII